MIKSGKLLFLLVLSAGLSLCNCESKYIEIPESQTPHQPGGNGENGNEDDGENNNGGGDETDYGEFVLTKSVSIYGNTYVTQNPEYAPVLNSNGISSWTHPAGVVSAFFRVSNPGVLNVGLYGKAPNGGAKLNVTVAGEQFTIVVNNTADGVIKVGQVKVDKAGYVRVDLKGQSGLTGFGSYSEIRIGGPAAEGAVTSVPATGSGNWPYWGRRGPSVHMKYTKPSDNVRYFYNEVTVPEGNDVLYSYFMANGFSGGYMGMQVNDVDAAKRRILFSVWSAYTTDNPNDIPEEYRVVTLRKGAGVHIGEFGNEGSGGQSYLLYPWEAGKTYKFLTEVRPDGTKKTVFTGYFCGHDGQWKLIASFMRPDPKKTTESHYTGMHSFLENFSPEMGYAERQVRFGNQWAYTTDGRWIELTEGMFTYDNTAAQGIRLDYDGGLENGDFYLRNCGFFDDNRTYGTKFTRLAKGTAPQIDFAALERIPTTIN